MQKKKRRTFSIFSAYTFLPKLIGSVYSFYTPIENTPLNMYANQFWDEKEKENFFHFFCIHLPPNLFPSNQQYDSCGLCSRHHNYHRIHRLHHLLCSPYRTHYRECRCLLHIPVLSCLNFLLMLPESPPGTSLPHILQHKTRQLVSDDTAWEVL